MYFKDLAKHFKTYITYYYFCLDPKLGEKVCVAHISKQSNQNKRQINLKARNNRPITLKISKKRFETKAQYNDKQIPKSEITKLKLDTGMSDRNIKKTCCYFRNWTGRKTFESGASNDTEVNFSPNLFESVDIELDGELKTLVYCTNVPGKLHNFSQNLTIFITPPPRRQEKRPPGLPSRGRSAP